MDIKIPKVKKPMAIMLISVLVLFGGIFAYKIIMGNIIKHFMMNQSQIVTVSTTTAAYIDWKSELTASASLRAIRGVNVTTELSGMVEKIYFTPGLLVKKDTVLVQLNADTNIAQLHSLQAQAELAKITYRRDKAQYAVKAISQATLDSDIANLKNLNAQVAEQIDTVKKKTIIAPFTGHLGVCEVNPGQFLNPGDAVVSLQQLDPIYADFYVPQQALVKLKMGQMVAITLDSFPGQIFHGRVTTVNPVVDTNTRNVEIEATITNPEFKLIPGMFATATVQTGSSEHYLTLPQTAISYNPYGNVVYIVNNKDPKKLTVTQSFVNTGEVRGDQVAVLSGLKEGQIVVTGGQIKLKNGSQIVINNKIEPDDSADPKLVSE